MSYIIYFNFYFNVICTWYTMMAKKPWNAILTVPVLSTMILVMILHQEYLWRGTFLSSAMIKLDKFRFAGNRITPSNGIVFGKIFASLQQYAMYCHASGTIVFRLASAIKWTWFHYTKAYLRKSILANIILTKWNFSLATWYVVPNPNTSVAISQMLMEQDEFFDHHTSIW